MHVLLRADRRLKQDHEDVFLLAHLQELFLLGKERIWNGVEPGEYSISDYEVSKKLIRLLCRGSLPRENDGATEFWRMKDNLQKHFLYCHHWFIIGPTTSGRKTWQEEETRKDTSIVLIRQEQSCTSELFKVIQDGVSLILLHRTMSLFRTVSSSTFVMSDDVQSIYIPSSIRD